MMKPLLLLREVYPFFIDVKKGVTGLIKTTQQKDTDSWIYEVKEGSKKGERSKSFTCSGKQYYISLRRAYTNFNNNLGKEKQNKHNK